MILKRARRHTPRPRFARPAIEALEDRCLPSVTIAPTNNSGQGYTGLDYNHSGGWVPPDTCGAAGPSSYVETVNLTVAIYTPKATGSTHVAASFSTFFSGLPPVDSSSRFSDPIVVYDDNMPSRTPTTGCFIIGVQNVDFTNGQGVFDIAVSKTASPATLTAADWNFYQINTTQPGFSSDYPGNFGYNKDAFVFTLNQYNNGLGPTHVEVFSVNASDLVSGVPQGQLRFFHNDVSNDFSLRPTTMHDAAPGSPMWLVSQVGDGRDINVYKMTNELTNSAQFARTPLAVNPYTDISAVPPLQPDGTTITDDINSRILKASEAHNTLVATHAVSVSSTQDVAQWYVIDVSSGTPVLQQQGDVTLGNNTYASYPGIDINPSGNIGMSFMDSGAAAGRFLSMYVTGRAPSDASGTMEAPVLVPSGTGKRNYSAGGRAGDLSGINTDPSDGSFWAANEFANTDASANWGTAIANFRPTTPDKPLIATGTSILAAKGVTFNGVVASLSDADSVPGGAAAYVAVINWGDGSPPTLGTIATSSGGGFNVSGTHNYASTGQYQVTVTVTDKDTSHDDGGSSATAVTTATVSVLWADGSGYIYVLDAGRNVYRSSNGGGSWQATRGNVTALAADGSGYVYELDADRSVYRINGASGWQAIRGNVTALAADGSGFVYELDADRSVYRISGGSGWQATRGNVAALAADGGGFVYELDADRNVYRINGNTGWQATRGNVAALAADGSGFVYELDADRNVYRISGASGWQATRGNVAALAADGSGFAYELDADRNVYRIDGASGWQAVLGSVTALAADGSGFVYELDANHNVYRRCGNLDWQATRGNVAALAADGSGFVYELDADHNVYRCCGNTGWQAARGNVTALAADGSGYVYELDADRNVYRICGNSGWQATRGNVAGLVADGGGLVYVLDSSHAVYAWSNGRWSQLTGYNVQALASAGAYAYILDSNHAVSRYLSGSNTWQGLTGSNIQALVSDGAFVYILDSLHAVYAWSNGRWSQLTGGNVTTLASDGAYAYILDSNHAVSRYLYGSNTWQGLTGANIQAMVSDGAFVYILDSLHAVYAWSNGRWSQLTGFNVQALASDGAYAYILDSNHTVSLYLYGTNTWRPITGANIEALVAEGSGFVYTLSDDHNVSRWNGSNWQVVRSNVAALVAGGSGSIYALGLTDQTVYRCDGGDWLVYAIGVQSLTGDPFGGGSWTDLAGVTHPLP